MEDGYAAYHKFDEYVPAIGRNGEALVDDNTGRPIKVGIITDWEDMKAWADVEASLVFRPRDFTQILKDSMKDQHRVGWVGWDDINIHLPRSMYFTKRRLWETLAKNWEGMRANMNIFECTAPRKDRVASFILGDMNWEALCSSQQAEAVRRWFWESDYYEPEKVNKYRIDVEEKSIAERHIPNEIWNHYWDRKSTLTDESTDDMITTLDDLDKPVEPKPEKPISPTAKAARDQRAKIIPV